jgi:hypothetical protein
MAKSSLEVFVSMVCPCEKRNLTGRKRDFVGGWHEDESRCRACEREEKYFRRVSLATCNALVARDTSLRFHERVGLANQNQRLVAKVTVCNSSRCWSRMGSSSGTRDGGLYLCKI